MKKQVRMIKLDKAGRERLKSYIKMSLVIDDIHNDKLQGCMFINRFSNIAAIAYVLGRLRLMKWAHKNIERLNDRSEELQEQQEWANEIGLLDDFYEDDEYEERLE